MKIGKFLFSMEKVKQTYVDKLKLYLEFGGKKLHTKKEILEHGKKIRIDSETAVHCFGDKGGLFEKSGRSSGESKDNHEKIMNEEIEKVKDDKTLYRLNLSGISFLIGKSKLGPIFYSIAC